MTDDVKTAPPEKLATPDAPGGAPVSGAQSEKGFRMDIQGVRGVALLLVLAAHAKLPGFAGGYVGLSVFYVLSGFLITGLILTEIERKGNVSLVNFYARRAKRLLPAAATVLAFCAVGAAVLYSPAEIQRIAEDIFAAAVYVVNWHFIAESVDYFAGDASNVSPVQHYWSLSVEEQFYVLWPLTMAAGALIARKLGLGLRKAAALLIVPIGVISLIYSVKFTAIDARDAYFSTFARAWELAVGGALALVLPAGLKLRRPLPALLAGAGIVALVASAIAYDDHTPYPGWQALLPVTAGLAIIVGGTATVLSAPVKLLKLGALQYVGKISYSWYLWHWPVLIFAGAIWGELGTPELVLVTLASAVPAILTHHGIEEPFRRSPSLGRSARRGLAVGVSCTAIGVFVAIGLQTAFPLLPTASPELARGAQAIGPRNPELKQVDALRPNPVDAKSDKGLLAEDGCVLLKNETVSPPCVYGNPRSSKTVVMFGDSHALEWFAPMIKLAERRNWRLVGLSRAGCVISQVTFERPCNVWRRNAMRRMIQRERPDMVVISTSTGRRYEIFRGGRKLSRTRSQPFLVAGFAQTVRRLKRTGARVVLIRDHALAPFLPPVCVSQNRDNLRRCTFPARRKAGWAFDFYGARRAKIPIVDPVRILCPRNRCPSVMGNVLVYRDNYHMTATFAKTLTPWLGRQLPPVRETEPAVK